MAIFHNSDLDSPTYFGFDSSSSGLQQLGDLEKYVAPVFFLDAG
jgi:hypothetical protein